MLSAREIAGILACALIHHSNAITTLPSKFTIYHLPQRI
jgi:hypothetical protein